MENELFFVDDEAGLNISYEQLAADVDRIVTPATTLVFDECYPLFLQLLAAIDRHKPLLLLDDEQQQATWSDSSLPTAAQPLQHVPRRSFDAGPTADRWSLAALMASGCRIGLLTSGTTGQPKLVYHSMASLARSVQASERHRSDVWGFAYHPARLAGLQVLFQAIANGNRLVRLFGLSPNQMHDTLETQRVTHLSATPTLLRLLASEGAVHTHVQRVTSGGEALDPQLLELLSRTFPNARIRNVYASTEAGTVLTSDGELFQVPAPQRGLIRIIDGELAIHRDLLAQSLQTDLVDDFYRTGDCVQVIQDDPLTFRFTSRRSDLINVGGSKVNPREVEAKLLEMPEVRQVLVYGKQNSVTGNLVCCDLVLSPGKQLTIRQVIACLQPQLPPYMIPRIINIVQQLPLTPNGKQRREP